MVRDDAIHLYGFAEGSEKEAFGHLCTVKGVGPKLALGILSGIATDDLWLAVRGRDAERLSKVPGIGKKTAARLVVELEGKLPETAEAPPGQGGRALGRGRGKRAHEPGLSRGGGPKVRGPRPEEGRAGRRS